jgi:hypothetical protein
MEGYFEIHNEKMGGGLEDNYFSIPRKYLIQPKIPSQLFVPSIKS